MTGANTWKHESSKTHVQHSPLTQRRDMATQVFPPG